MFAYLDYIERNRAARRIELLQLYALAATGDAKAIKRQLDEWDKDV